MSSRLKSCGPISTTGLRDGRDLPEDVPYGEGIIEIYKPFVEELLSRYSLNTVKRHLDNLWLLGGELIRSINMDPEDREKTPMELLLDNIDEIGGPYCRHLDSDEQMRCLMSDLQEAVIKYFCMDAEAKADI